MYLHKSPLVCPFFPALLLFSSKPVYWFASFPCSSSEGHGALGAGAKEVISRQKMQVGTWKEA